MTKAGQNFTVYKNDNKTVKIAVEDSAGDPKNLSGASAIWIVYDVPDTILITKETGGSGITIVNMNGTLDGLQIDLTSANTNALTAGLYTHQADVTDTEDNRETVAIGTMKVYD